MTDEMVTIPKLSAQVVFDALCHSLDFGSGFLDTEEVEALRALAVALGVDPNVGTPDPFKARYPHAYEPETDRYLVAHLVDALDRNNRDKDGRYVIDEARMPDYAPCEVGTYGSYCAKPENDPIHQATRT